MSKFALLIANSEYTDPGLAQLTAPGQDAQDLARVLQSSDISAFDQVRVLMNEPESVVREAIDGFFTQKKKDDLLVLYFSGHGVRDEQGTLYLALKNTNRERLRSTAIKSDFIRESMDQSHSRRQVLILDCCNSGAFAQGTKAALGASMGTGAAFEGSGFGKVVLTATDSTQFAWEGDKVIGDTGTKNSLFTHYLVKGLEGEADRDADGSISVDDLYEYAYGEIVSRTPRQTPVKFAYKQQGKIYLRQGRTDDIQPAPASRPEPFRQPEAGAAFSANVKEKASRPGWALVLWITLGLMPVQFITLFEYIYKVGDPYSGLISLLTGIYGGYLVAFILQRARVILLLKSMLWIIAGWIIAVIAGEAIILTIGARGLMGGGTFFLAILLGGIRGFSIAIALYGEKALPDRKTVLWITLGWMMAAIVYEILYNGLISVFGLVLLSGIVNTSLATSETKIAIAVGISRVISEFISMFMGGFVLIFPLRRRK